MSAISIVIVENNTTASVSVEKSIVKSLSALKHRGVHEPKKYLYPFDKLSLGLGQIQSQQQVLPAMQNSIESVCGQYALVYDGELYNSDELIADLKQEGCDFESSKGNLFLAALSHWGYKAFERFNGIWALAFLDKKNQTLILSRDRLGVKPLFYHQDGNCFYAASEIKGVLEGTAGKKFKLNHDAVARFLLQSLVSAELETFFTGIQAFPPASYAVIPLNKTLEKITPRKYWWHLTEKPQPDNNAAVTSEQLKELFIDAVRIRTPEDKKFGCMLSGGLDSSAIVSVVRDSSPEAKLHAVSVVSRDPETSEEPFIDIMAQHTECEVLKLQSDDEPIQLWNQFEDATWKLEFPASSFSVLAHQKVIKAAHDKGITVLLSGQGADEQLGGYNKFLYFYLQDRLRRGQIAAPLSMLWGCIKERTILSEFKLGNAKRYIPFLRGTLSRNWVGDALEGAKLLSTGLGQSYELREWQDLSRFSLPTLLISEDRLTISNHVQMRTPFLDHRLIDLVAHISPEQKLVCGWTKHIFREAMQDMLPPQITWRKDKKGYSLPGHNWMCGVLKPKVEKVLNGPMLSANFGLIDQKGAQILFASLVAGDKNVRYQDVLSIVALEYWLKIFSSYLAEV